jgi:radical SAM protein with 4Fe4S-binding SPASM domain
MNELAPPLPRELQVEVTGACNLRCRMCLVRYREPLDRVGNSMSLATFRRLVDELEGVERITLQGLGEPLLAPDLVAMVEHASSRGIAVGFNTNGTLLTALKADRLIAAGLDWLHVSVDGATRDTYESIRDGARFERVERNVRGLVAAMRRAGAERPELSLVFVAMRSNVAELPAMVRLSADWGVPRLWVQSLSHDFDDTDAAPPYREIREFTHREALWGDGPTPHGTLFADARTLADELGVDLRLPDAQQCPQPPRAPETPGCDWPWRSTYVTHDGRVQPCCMVMGSERAVLGNVHDQSFRALWHARAYQEFRARLLTGDDPPEVCRGCSLYRGVF